MSEQTKQEMEVVERLEDIPAFVTEDEEQRYRATHTLSKALLNQIGSVDDGFLPLSSSSHQAGTYPLQR
jgi:hypothetical protein